MRLPMSRRLLAVLSAALVAFAAVTAVAVKYAKDRLDGLGHAASGDWSRLS